MGVSRVWTVHTHTFTFRSSLSLGCGHRFPEWECSSPGCSSHSAFTRSWADQKQWHWALVRTCRSWAAHHPHGSQQTELTAIRYSNFSRHTHPPPIFWLLKAPGTLAGFTQRQEGRQCTCVVTSMRVCSALILYDRPMALLKWDRSREHQHPNLCWVETQETRALPIKLVHCLTGSKLSCSWMWYMTSVIALGS